MAKKVKFELNLPGLNELMKSPEMQAVMNDAGQAVALSAGPGFESRVWLHKWVAITNIYPVTDEAKKKTYAENHLLKALGSAGLFM